MQPLRIRDLELSLSWPRGEKRPRLTIINSAIRQGQYTEINRPELIQLAKWAAAAATNGLIDPFTNEPRAVPDDVV